MNFLLLYLYKQLNHPSPSRNVISIRQCWGSGFWPNSDPGLCTSNKGRFIKILLNEYFQIFQSLVLILLVTDILCKPWIRIRIRAGLLDLGHERNVWHQKYANKKKADTNIWIWIPRRYCVKCAEFYCNEFPAEMQPRIRDGLLFDNKSFMVILKWLILTWPILYGNLLYKMGQNLHNLECHEKKNMKEKPFFKINM